MTTLGWILGGVADILGLECECFLCVCVGVCVCVCVCVCIRERALPFSVMRCGPHTNNELTRDPYSHSLAENTSIVPHTHTHTYILFLCHTHTLTLIHSHTHTHSYILSL